MQARAESTSARIDAPLTRRAAPGNYGSIPMKDLKSRIVVFSFTVLLSLAAWGGVVYVAIHFFKKHG